MEGGRRLLAHLERRGGPGTELELLRRGSLVRDLLEQGGRENVLRALELLEPLPKHALREPILEDLELVRDPDVQALHELIASVRRTLTIPEDSEPARAEKEDSLPVTLEFAHPFFSKYESEKVNGLHASTLAWAALDSGSILLRADTGAWFATPFFLAGEARAESAFVVLAEAPPGAGAALVTATATINLQTSVSQNLYPDLGGLTTVLLGTGHADGGVFLDFLKAQELASVQREKLSFGPFGAGNEQHLREVQVYVRRWFATEPGAVYAIRFGLWGMADNYVDGGSDEMWATVRLDTFNRDGGPFANPIRVSVRFAESVTAPTAVDKGVGTPPPLPPT